MGVGSHQSLSLLSLSRSGLMANQSNAPVKNLRRRSPKRGRGPSWYVHIGNLWVNMCFLSSSGNLWFVLIQFDTIWPATSLTLTKKLTPQLDPDLSQLNPNLSQLNPDLLQLNPNLSQLNPNLSKLNTNLSQLNPDLSQLNPNLSQLNPNLSQLNPNLSQLNPNTKKTNTHLRRSGACTETSCTTSRAQDGWAGPHLVYYLWHEVNYFWFTYVIFMS